ncbi:cytochrome P450 [Dendrothele bispora CBS 962.96]|uniref:Cytochrome P450 n=1 Tax=Dendrothele bispora (strain CBS 962.96) TaxID=1314807 RepID=A0A4S8KT82_DENBC|nr:cytochrome P450 [Dendrothele bispora CBS 962.96]
MSTSIYSSLLPPFAIVVISFAFLSFFRRYNYRSGVSLANIPGPGTRSWWKGNFGEALNPATAWEFHQKLLKEFEPVVRLDGMMGDKTVFTYDPKAMQHILVKDQAFFERTNITTSKLMFGEGLTAIAGEAHRKQRKALNPVFSIAHMRDMLPVFYNVIHKLDSGLSSQLQKGDGPQEIEMLSWASRTAFELIGQAGLGYSFDELGDETDAQPDCLSFDTNPKLHHTYRRQIGYTETTTVAHEDISDYLYGFAREVYRGKTQALAQGDEAVAQQVGKGKDIMSILMRLNLEADEQDRLSEDEVLGQMSVLMFAAVDTTSSAIARTLHLLVTHPEVQDKLREELLEAQREDEDIPYDKLVSLPYLDAICRETLRLFPPAPYLLRHSVQDTMLPLSNPIKGLDGTSISEVHVPRNTRILVSIINSNRNPTIWGPDAHEWKPERWLSKLPESLTEARIPGVYSHLMTFNAGGRSCIGFKFSQLEMKAVLSMLIAKFKFAPSKKEIIWRMYDIMTPTVNGERRSQMPLIVSRA